MRIWGAGRQGLTAADLLRRIAAVLWSIQVDAAAKIDEDEVLCCCGGDGAQAAAESREEEDDRKGRMKKDLKAMRIYKGRLISGREKRGGRKHDYPTTATPRFSGWSLR